MKGIKITLIAILGALTLCSCGRKEPKATPSPEPTLAVTDSPTSSPNNTNGEEGVMGEMGNMVEDAGNAVGEAAKDAGNAVNDMVGDGR